LACDIQVNAPLDGVTAEQHAIPGVEYPEVAFAVTR
jgi:hypothetical protein